MRNIIKHVLVECKMLTNCENKCLFLQSFALLLAYTMLCMGAFAVVGSPGWKGERSPTIAQMSRLVKRGPCLSCTDLKVFDSTHCLWSGFLNCQSCVEWNKDKIFLKTNDDNVKKNMFFFYIFYFYELFFHFLSLDDNLLWYFTKNLN